MSREFGKSNLVGCSGASEKLENSNLGLQFLIQPVGGVFPGPPAEGFRWGAYN